MSLYTPSSPHLHADTSVSKVMLTVCAALLPAVAVSLMLFGWAVIVQILLASLTALAAEALMLKVRQRPLAPFLGDGSALVTAWLLALSLPAISPWWLTVLGTLFAIVVVKQLYGGLGYNVFNPAMAGYAMLLVSFPLEMTRWQVPGQPLSLAQSLSLIFGGPQDMDAVSGATVLDHLKTQLRLGETGIDPLMQSPLFGFFGGTGWEWINLALLAGGLFLLWRKIIGWQIPVAMLASLALCAGLFHVIDPNQYASPLFHVSSGAAILGAFFIATDPVSAATSPRGRLIYGAGIGLLVYVIRTWGGYPDGVAFAVLLMNMVAPLIDHYTKPRVFGHE